MSAIAMESVPKVAKIREDRTAAHVHLSSN